MGPPSATFLYFMDMANGRNSQLRSVRTGPRDLTRQCRSGHQQELGFFPSVSLQKNWASGSMWCKKKWKKIKTKRDKEKREWERGRVRERERETGIGLCCVDQPGRTGPYQSHRILSQKSQLNENMSGAVFTAVISSLNSNLTLSRAE